MRAMRCRGLHAPDAKKSKTILQKRSWKRLDVVYTGWQEKGQIQKRTNVYMMNCGQPSPNEGPITGIGTSKTVNGKPTKNPEFL